MALNIEELMKRAKEYVEIEAKTKVGKVVFAESHNLLGQEDVVLSVSTTDKDEKDWWVVGGSTPLNLYPKGKFPYAHEAFTFHTGLMIQLAARESVGSPEAPDAIGYDAFICHASEDKGAFVRPLANALKKMGFRIWYDEFELRVGDKLHQSIDKGLSVSRYGVVVLSKAFFDKNWPRYELDGLAAREIEGEKVILPIWYGVGNDDVLRYSAPLADRVALDSQKLSLSKIADALASELRAVTHL